MFDEILKKDNGAKFFAIDGLVFTPASPFYEDYREGAEEEIVKRIADNLKNREIDLVIIGDENLGLEERGEGKWQDFLRQECLLKNIVVYPGFTVITKDEKKLLFVFSPGTPFSRMDTLLSELGLKKGERFYRNNNPVPLELSSDEVLKRKEKDYLILFIYEGKEVDERFNGIVSFEDLKSSKGVLLGSFARRAEDVGMKKSYVKMGFKNIEGLRMVFLDPEVKIRYSTVEIRHPRIIACAWKGGFLDGVSVHMNPFFNVLIGGRGTGKTTMIETIRYALGAVPRTERNKKTHEQILREVFKPGSKISVLVETQAPGKKRYRIERIYPFKPAVYDEETGEKLDIEPSDIFNIEIYGSKEIFEITKKSDFQYELIKQRMKDEIIHFEEERRRLIKEIEDIEQSMEKYEKDIKEKEKEISKIPGIRERIKRFEELGIPEKIAKKRKIEEERFLFEESAKKVDEIAKKLAEMVTEFIPSFKDIAEGTEECSLVLKDYRNYFKDSVLEFEKVFNRAIEVLKNIRNKNEESKKKWEEESIKIEEEYRESLRKLQLEYPGLDIEEYVELENELKKLIEIEKEVTANKNKLNMLVEDRKRKLEELRNIIKEEYDKVKEQVEKWNKMLEGRIRIDFSYKNPPHVLKKMKEIFPEVREELLKELAEKFTPQEIAEILKERAYDKLNINGVPAAEIARYAVFNDKKRLNQLERMYYPPFVVFNLNVGNSEKPIWKNIESLSDGQRCTVILEFLLLSDDAPLIVDQPEEDMDNRYIVEEVVKKIRKEKDKRQFLFATHNANLPVLGDADLFICLEADTEKAYLKEGNYGYLDSKKIKELVYDYLEGGKEAFQQRKHRYGEE